MPINVKMDDVVVPRIRLGKVVKVSEEEVQIEYKNTNGDLQYSTLSKEQSDRRGISFEDMVNGALIKLDGVDYNKV